MKVRELIVEKVLEFKKIDSNQSLIPLGFTQRRDLNSMIKR